MRVITPVIVICGLLATACSPSSEPTTANSDSAPVSTSSSASPGQFPADRPVMDRVNYYVTRLRPQLPMPINDATVMESVTQNGLEIELHYQVVDRSVTRRQMEAWLADNAPRNTCNNQMTAQMVRDGASFRYTYSGGSLSQPISRVVTRC